MSIQYSCPKCDGDLCCPLARCERCGDEPNVNAQRFDPYYTSSQGCWMSASMEECEDGDWVRHEDVWPALHSARYILEDANPEALANACGLPLGVIANALENILK